MGDPVLDKLFNGFGYVFAPMLVGTMLGMLTMVVWLALSFVDKILDGFEMGKMLAQPNNFTTAHKVSRKVALDFVLEERRKRQREAQQRLHELMNEPAPVRIKAREQREAESEYSLESLQEVLKPKPVPVKPENRRDLWALGRYENGCTRYLIFKKSSRAGLQTAFAALPEKKLTFPLSVARRWISLMPEGTVILPASAAARILLRNHGEEIYDV